MLLISFEIGLRAVQEGLLKLLKFVESCYSSDLVRGLRVVRWCNGMFIAVAAKLYSPLTRQLTENLMAQSIVEWSYTPQNFFEAPPAKWWPDYPSRPTPYPTR
jgi:hypothetical protein